MPTPLFAERDRRANESRLSLQALHRRELAASGRRLAQSREATGAELRRLAAYVPGAKHSGIPITEISSLTGLSRPTIYTMLNEPAPIDREPELVLLNALASLGAQATTDLAAFLRAEEAAVGALVEKLRLHELVSVGIHYYTPDMPAAVVMLTKAGGDRLQTLLSQA